MLPCRIGESKFRQERENEEEEEEEGEKEGGGGGDGAADHDGGGGGLPRVAQSLHLMTPARDLGWMPMTKRSGGKVDITTSFFLESS